MDKLFDEFLASTVVGGFGSAIGLVVLFSYSKSRTNVALALLLIFIGLGRCCGPSPAGH